MTSSMEKVQKVGMPAQPVRDAIEGDGQKIGKQQRPSVNRQGVEPHRDVLEHQRHANLRRDQAAIIE